MVIDNKQYEVILKVKKVKNLTIRVKVIDDKPCIIVTSYKKMNDKKLNDLLLTNIDSIRKLINKIVINPIKEDEILIFGKIYDVKYKDELTKYAFNEIIKLFDSYKNIFKRNDTVLKFRKMKTRWGVCYLNKNAISLTKSIIHIPLELIEYVIIHEFCHFKHPNHSKDFYKEVELYCFDYKKRVKKLKSYSYVLR